jgi:hypothetical protein
MASQDTTNLVTGEADCHFVSKNVADRNVYFFAADAILLKFDMHCLLPDKETFKILRLPCRHCLSSTANACAAAMKIQ